MALKRLFVQIKNDIFDVWTLASVEAEDDYNEVRGDFDYLLIINATAVTKDVKAKTYRYTTLEERDEQLHKIKDAMKANPNMYFLGENDGSMDDDEVDHLRSSTPRKEHEDELEKDEE